jgi:hypothetical protein
MRFWAHAPRFQSGEDVLPAALCLCDDAFWRETGPIDAWGA